MRTCSIIAHDEDRALRDENRSEVSPTVTRRDDRWVKVGLKKKLPANPNLATSHFNLFTTDCDHPLDEIAFGRSSNFMEHNHIAAIWVVKAVRDLIDKYSITGFERRVHRRSFNDEVSEKKCSNSKSND